jgi:hypothetical protein
MDEKAGTCLPTRDSSCLRRRIHNSLTLQKSTSIPFSTAFKKRESPGNLKHFIDAVASLSRAFDVHERIDFLADRFTLQ